MADSIEFKMVVAQTDFAVYQHANMHSQIVSQVFEGTEIYINPNSPTHWTECKVRGKCGWALKTNFDGLMLALKTTKKQNTLLHSA